MSPPALLRALFPAYAFRRAACTVLQSRPAAPDWPELWRDSQAEQQRLREGRTGRHAPGLYLLLRYLEWDCALYLVLRRRGWSEADAGAAITEINWAILGPPIALAHALSRLRSGQAGRRVAWLLDALFLLVFTAPFRRRAVPPGQGLSFDVLVCPLADYFRRQGLPELTHHAACQLDYRMARDWGVQLHRRQTLAGGGDHCDFRFRVVVEDPQRDASRPS